MQVLQVSDSAERLRVKVPDEAGDALNVARGEVRMQRQGQDFARGPLGMGEATASHIARCKSRMKVKRNRIVHACLNAMLREMGP